MAPKMKEDEVRRAVRENYAKLAARQGCCSTKSITSWPPCGRDCYSSAEIKGLPEGSNLGLGCGNPVALASVRRGETVVDLGSGGGLDCFLASKKVGRKGKVIGVDMTPEMIELARENARKGNYPNVEFRLGEIENIPVADAIADLVISNCVVNLSTDKRRVFDEAYRVLRPGGRLMVSDIVLLEKLPEALVKSIEVYVSCIGGAVLKDDYLAMIREAGFDDVKIVSEVSYPTSQTDLDDPTVADILKNLNMSKEQALKIMGTFVKALVVTIYGRKPMS